MAKRAVVFRSKYGASKEYALALGRMIQAEVIENDGLTPQLVDEFDSIALVGGVYAGKITGLDFFRKNAADFSSKRLAVFAVGAAPDSHENTEDLRKRNMKGRLESVPVYYGRGSFDEAALTFVDRNLLAIVRKAAARTNPEKRSPLDNVILGTTEPVSWVDESYLSGIAGYMMEE